MRYLLHIFFCVFICGEISAQDIIHKTDSALVEAKVTEIDVQAVKYRKFSNPDGPVYSIPKAEVAYIVYQNGEKEIITKAPPPVVLQPFDTLAYIEKMLGVTLQEVTVPDTGLLIVDVVNTGRVTAPGLQPPKNNILQYIGTTDKKSQLKAEGKKIVTKQDAVRAIVDYKNQGVNKVYFFMRFSQYVDHVYTADITDLVFRQNLIVEKEKKDSIAESTRLPSPYKRLHFGLNIGMSLRNDYSTTDLNLWMYEMNGVYDDAGLSDGPEAFYFANFYCSFPLNKKKKRPVCAGVSLLINYRKDTYGFWSIQGRVISYAPVAPVTYIRMRPFKLGVGIPFRFPITDYSAFTFTPTLMYAAITGYSSGSDPNFADARVYGHGSDGFGISADAGVEFFLGKRKLFGVNALIGYRELRTDLNYSLESDQVNWYPVQFSSGDQVHCDLDGLYLELALAMRFPKKK